MTPASALTTRAASTAILASAVLAPLADTADTFPVDDQGQLSRSRT